MTFAQAPITLGRELGMEEEMRDDDGDCGVHSFSKFRTTKLQYVTGDGRTDGQHETTPSFFTLGFISLLRPVRHVLGVVFSRAEEGQFSVPRVPFRID